MTLRVKLEIVPHGKEEETYEIGRLDIFNVGLAEFGHHEYRVIEINEERGGLHQRSLFHRRQLGAWALVKKALEALEIEGP